MRKNLMIYIILLVIVPGLLFTVSCAKKVVQSEPAAEEEPAAVVEEQQETEEEKANRIAAEEKAVQEEAARQAELKAQEELKQQQLAEQAAKEAERTMMAAMQMFMNEDIYFDFDSSVLGAIAKEVLSRKADWLRENSDVLVIIEGHCDERGTNAYNIALGDRRAERAKAFLVDLGLDASRLTTISYGEERPVAVGKNEEAWAKNRRAHFVVE